MGAYWSQWIASALRWSGVLAKIKSRKTLLGMTGVWLATSRAMASGYCLKKVASPAGKSTRSESVKQTVLHLSVWAMELRAGFLPMENGLFQFLLDRRST